MDCQPSLQTGRKTPRGRSLRALGLHLRLSTSPPASPFPVSPDLGWRHLKPSSSAGGPGTCRPAVEKTRGWNQRDLIKALTVRRAVTRSWGQPEKVVTHLFPHLTYRPAWRVVPGAARGSSVAPETVPFLLRACQLRSSPEAGIRATMQSWRQSSDPSLQRSRHPYPVSGPGLALGWAWGPEEEVSPTQA